MTRPALLFFFLLAAALIYTEAFTAGASADEISGYTELDYSHTHMTTDNGNGKVSSSNSNDFFQRYSLALTKQLYPNLKLLASGIFQQDVTTTRDEAGETKSTTTIVQPLISLSLYTPFVGAGVFYNSLQVTSKSGGSSQTVVQDNYAASLNLRPEGLPTLDISLQRLVTHDKERLFADTLDDRLSVGTKYTPVRNLDLGYQFNYDNTDDRLRDAVTTQVTNSARFSYSRSFWGDRGRLDAGGNLALLNTTATVGTAGTSGILFSQSATSGLYAAGSTADSPVGVDLPPQTPANDAMKSTPFLINGGDFPSNVGKLNIGFPKTNPADSNPRSAGLAFAQPTELSAIFVTVNQDVASIATSYSWDVYISNDINIGQGLNPTATQQWTLYQQAATFTFSEIDRTFQISFQKVTAQFFKVVAKPLPVPAFLPGVDVNNILITQLQAFDTTAPSQASVNKTTTFSQNYNLSARVRLLDRPSIYYDLTTYYSTTSNNGSGFAVGQPSQSAYVISNGLSGTYQLSRIFAASARVARNDSKFPAGTSVAYLYNTTLTAVPLPTLTNALSFSGNREQINGQSQDTTSLYLTNLAELYKGVNVALSGGYSWGTTFFQKNTSEILTASLSVAPYRVLTINSDYSYSRSKTTGGSLPDSESTSERADLSATYTPFPALNLFGSIGMFTAGTNSRANTIVSYGVNWAPFPDGTLQISLPYTESITSFNSEKDTTIAPYVRWNITRYAYLTVTYQIFKTKSVIIEVPQSAKIETLSAVLHISF